MLKMKISADTVASWRERCATWLAPRNLTPDAILTGRDAWTVAHRSGLTAEAYQDRDVVDAHIQTALERIFPNAVFQDAKRY
jgi:hypothetical protein